MLPYTRSIRFARTVLPAIFVLAISLALVAGCAKNKQQSQAQGDTGQSSPWAAKAKSKPQPRDDFEKGKEDPIGPETYFAAGQLSETQEATNRAEDYYKKALEMDGMHKGSLFRMGIMTAKQKRYGEAIQYFERYVTATKGDATGYANLGFVYELAGRSDEAETAYRKGIKADPLNAPCRVNFGLMLARHDRINESMLEMQTVLSEAQVHYNIASVFELQGKKDEARAAYRRALSADPKMADAQVRLDSMN